MMPREDELEFVLLVNHSTEEILKSSRFEISGDGKSWVSSEISVVDMEGFSNPATRRC
jgi:hypothetical protein